MPMKNPPHPGEMVRTEVLQPLGLLLTKAAEILGVRRATLSDLANGKTAVSAEMALRLEKAFGVSMDLLLRMQAGHDAAQARRRASEIDVALPPRPCPSDRLTPRPSRSDPN
jgi:antitoxin HigA-1